MTHSRKRKWLKNASLSLLSIGFTLALLEIAVRTMHLGSGGFWEPYSLYGWRNIPGARGWESCYGDCEVYIEINSKGLRDVEIAYEKPANTQRILLLGDSMTAAFQVPLEDSFGKVVEQELNAADLDSSDWQVVNGGINGFGTDNELIFFRLEGKKYQPDLVVVGMYLANDIYNNSYILETRLGGSGHKPYFTLDETGELVLHNYPVPDTDSFSIRAGTFLKKHFQLPRFIAQVLSLRKQNNVPAALKPLLELAAGQRGALEIQQQQAETDNNRGDDGTRPFRTISICEEEYAPRTAEAWAITEALLLEMQAEVEAAGAEMIVLSIPAMPQLVPPAEGGAWYCDRPNEELNRFLDEAGIPYLDLLEPFRQHFVEGGAPLYYETDFHLNANGHHLAGELLGQYLIERESND
jgi:hypothetical protein